jgi:serine/threonine-protein kinase
VRLTHPAIVQVRAFVEDEGFAAIVFDYVEGIALSRLLRFCSALGARLPDRIGWHVVERVLAALSVAHAQKDDSGQPAPIVHRDVSPSNVLISFQGDVKLTDFGIAKMLGVSPATRLGLVKGTLGCMAPEQARGEPVDERADVYALGVMMYEMLTGIPPYSRGDHMAVMYQHVQGKARAPQEINPGLSANLAEVVVKAMAVDKAKRFQTMEEYRGALERFL